MTPQIKDFLSLRGSYSRKELIIAYVIIFACFVLLVGLIGIFKEHEWSRGLRYLIFPIIICYGIAVGKRSRDLGTSFTYGMIIGTIIPIFGIIFMFQAGKKRKLSNKTE